MYILRTVQKTKGNVTHSRATVPLHNMIIICLPHMYSVHTQRSRAQFCPFLLKFDKLQLTANWPNLSLHLLPQHFLPLPLTFHVTLLLLSILSIQYVAFVGPSLNLILAAHFLSTLLLNVGQLEPLQVKHSCSFELLFFLVLKTFLLIWCWCWELKMEYSKALTLMGV